MNIFQLILSFMAGIFITLSLFHFARSLFVVRKIDMYFYFFLVCLFSSLYVFFQIMGTTPLSEESYLLFHRFKLMSLGLGVIFWIYLIFKKCFTNMLFAHIFAVLSLVLISTIVFDIYLSYPVKQIQGNLGSIEYMYHLGESGLFYKIHGLLIVGSTMFLLLIGLFTRISVSKKIFLIFSTLPIILGGLHDYAVMYGYIQNIMLGEFFMLLFIVLIFVQFIVEEFRNYQKLDLDNLELESMVKNRTQELLLLNEELKKTAATDPLTGLNNRLEMENKIKDEIKRALRYHKNDNYVFSILFIDLDNFKYFNDSFGHLVGDILLKRFAEVLMDQIRDIDLAGRFGGDEFIIILPETRPKDALNLVKRIQNAIKQKEHFLPSISRYIDKSHLIPDTKKLNCSIGISEFSTQDKKNLHDLLREADDALYLAKRKGKNQAVIWQRG